jgi:hypothetical protein
MRDVIILTITLGICLVITVYTIYRCIRHIIDTVKNERNVKYYYILRDGYWWQRVSKLIYDSWTLEKKITRYELDEEEQICR